MKKQIVFFVSLLILALLFIGMALPVAAAPNAQGFSTATPGPDGRIIYIVQSGDNCSNVALIHNITVTQLRQFNTRLDEGCTLQEGEQLVVGLAPANLAPTLALTPTSAAPAISPTPFNGTTEVCVLLFDDMNGDALRQETEFGVDGGAVSLTNLNGSYSQTQNTSSALDDNGEPVRACFKDVPQGQYNVSMAVPDGYNPTMQVGYTLDVKAGDRASIDFGAQSKTLTITEPVTPEPSNNRSSLLGIFGLTLLLGGVGLGYYAYRSNQPQSKLKDSPLGKR